MPGKIHIPHKDYYANYSHGLTKEKEYNFNTLIEGIREHVKYLQNVKDIEYSKYFDNDIFKKLQNNNDDSASYIAAGNFNYVPKVAKVDYDLVSYQNLSNNTGFGVSPLADGLANKTKVNRG